MYIEKTIEAMKNIFKDIPWWIEHTLNVLKYAEAIIVGENVEENDRELISLAAILHDIGAVEALNKYGSMEAKYQEIEGEIVAKQILESIGYSPLKTSRISFIVGHHHTQDAIDGIDFQILWEADLLENMKSKTELSKNEMIHLIETNFITATGKRLAFKQS